MRLNAAATSSGCDIIMLLCRKNEQGRTRQRIGSSQRRGVRSAVKCYLSLNLAGMDEAIGMLDARDVYLQRTDDTLRKEGLF